ncbi:DbpA RNA binding domain-containing protein [Treponema brennaborense]|uniref:DbpA RNA-binding domain protein n=1 Tax=Treponema brennaborense (strain DSM 12168 / CIP 105900 / DD5/3) TaxID=906968 RepID=F4LPV8_TREBD|nr:DbpA RNA binding domain-containing protein [Treponema brennaborense]AEE16050.1 DbpA RNA-binding domain protein [Treponema brennaborense DSM 12168]
MSAKTFSSFDEERFTALLSDAVDRVKTEEDPVVLNELKKLFKKNVPFTLRMYVAAYLAKSGMSGMRGSYRNQRRDFANKPGELRGRRDSERTRRDDASDSPRRDSEPAFRRSRHEDGAAAEARQAPRRVTIDESLATTIFIGIGRNRRVFPRDLVGLLVQVAGLSRDRIGDIRTLDNYSFVQLFSEDAERVIESLNGYDYRGRKLSVSYSRKKEDETFEDDVPYQAENDSVPETECDDAAPSGYDAETDSVCDDAVCDDADAAGDAGDDMRNQDAE